MSDVALLVCAARALTSEATTANPFPDSPARAASMVAFRASKFVCSAISDMSLTISPIYLALTANEATSFAATFASLTAWPTMVVDSLVR